MAQKFKIRVHVKTRSKKEDITEVGSGVFSVKIHVPPVDGKANERIIELLSQYFKCPKTSITLVRGVKSKIKIFEFIPVGAREGT